MFANLLAGLLSKKLLMQLIFSLLSLAFSHVKDDVVRWIAQAEAHGEWTNEQKYKYVKEQLLKKYSKLEAYGWAVRFVIEWFVGQQKSKTGDLSTLVEVLK